MTQRTTKHGAHDQKPDKRKLRQLALYVATRCEDDPRFSRVKLNKVIFYADFTHYIKTGRSITGSAYIKMPYGPCPKDFNRLEKKMSQDEQMKIQERNYYGLTQKRPIALVPADLSSFTAEEIASVEHIISSFWHSSASDVSDLSHMFDGWKLADDFEEIPYSVARLGFNFELSPFHHKLAKDIAGRIASRQSVSA